MLHSNHITSAEPVIPYSPNEMEVDPCDNSTTTTTASHSMNHELPLLVSIRLLRDIAAGCGYLHTRNPPIIHRDLSSSNVLLAITRNISRNMKLLSEIAEDESRPLAKLNDFGLSRDVERFV